MSLALTRTVFGRLPSPIWAAASLLFATLTIYWQVTSPINTDVSWLLDVGNRVLGGARFYIDFLEVNPPASILLYIPAAALARWLPLSPDNAVRLLLLVGFGASLTLTAAPLRHAGLVSVGKTGVLICLASAVLLLLPMNTFAEREHIAVLASLPLLACFAARTVNCPPSLSVALLAGLGAGIAIAIKPMFGLGFVGPALYLLRKTSWRVALSNLEAWVAVAVAAAYGAGVLVLCPAFAANILPVAMAVYVPVRRPLATLLTSPGFTVWLLLSAAVLHQRSRAPVNPVADILALAAIGFQLAFLMQGKGFAYQAFPAVALATLAYGFPIAQPTKITAGFVKPSLAELAILAVPFVCAATFFTRHYDPHRWSPGLAEAMVALAPSPRVMSVSAELALGHPFVSEIGGTWVGTLPSTWISAYAREITGSPTTAGGLAPFVESERKIVTRDIERERPDIILIDDQDWLEWIAADPPLASAFQDYLRVGTYGNVMLWARKNELRP